MDLDSISSSLYLSSEEGLALVREATTAVHIALLKISNIKEYVKRQMILKHKNLKTTAPGTREDSAYPESNLKNIKIEIIDSDDSDCEFVPNDEHYEQPVSVESAQIGNDENFEYNSEQSLRHNLTNDHSTSLSNCDIQSEISGYSSLENGHNCIENLQVYFTIIFNCLTDSEVQNILIKEGFHDFSVIVKNKEFHSFGFIRFSNEESAKRAIDMSMKISIHGRAMKIVPYNSASGKRKSLPRREANETIENHYPEGMRHTIEENILINIPCGYERNRASESYTPIFRNVNETTNPSNYTDPYYTFKFSEKINYLNPLRVDQINKKLEQQTGISSNFPMDRSFDKCYLNARVNETINNEFINNLPESECNTSMFNVSDTNTKPHESQNSNDLPPQINISYRKVNPKNNYKNKCTKNKSNTNKKQTNKNKKQNNQIKENKNNQIKVNKNNQIKENKNNQIKVNKNNQQKKKVAKTRPKLLNNSYKKGLSSL